MRLCHPSLIGLLLLLCAGQRGQAAVLVLTPSEPDAMTQEAAALFAECLQRCTAEQVVLLEEDDARAAQASVHIGPTRYASELLEPVMGALPSHGFWIHGDGHKLVFLGKEPVATVFAVSRWAQEHFGVRFFTPLPHGTHWPTAPVDWQIPVVASSDAPAFTSRWTIAARHNPSWGRRNGFFNTQDFNHGIHRFFDQKGFAAAQWWPEFEGRAWPVRGGRAPQPDYSEPELAPAVAAWAQQRHFDQPHLDSVSVAMTDSILFDESPATRALVEPFTYFRDRPDYAPLLFDFMNRVAAAAFPEAGAGPDYDLSTLSYYWTENVPNFWIHPRVMPWLTSDRAQWFDPRYRANDQDLIRRWSVAGSRHLGTWDYYEGDPYIIPRHYPSLQADSIGYLHRHGVRAFFAEGEPLWGFDAPKYWLTGQLLWDPFLDVEVLLEDFYEHYYGPAAEPMKRFFERCEQIWLAQPGPASWIKHYACTTQLELFPPDVCRELRGYLADAEALAQTREHWQRVRDTSLTWVTLTDASRYYHRWKQLAGQWSVPAAQWAELDELRALLRPLQEAASGRAKVLWGRLLRPDPTARDTRTPAAAVALLQEGFESEVLPQDEQGYGIHPYSWKQYHGNPEHWRIVAHHTGHFWWQRSAQAARTGQWGLRLQGQKQHVMSHEFIASPGQLLFARLWARGVLSGDGVLMLQWEFEDAAGVRVGPAPVDMLPVGEHGWVPLAARADVPAEASLARLKIVLMNQYPGDYLDLDDIAIHHW